ncbi:MAG: hypothetical protein P8X57_04725 [Cyclobacteriaceae bacterium]
MLITIPLAAQDDRDVSIPLDHFYAKPVNSGLRSFFSKFYLSLSTGYGQTFYKQDLSEFAVLQQPDSFPVIFNGAGGISGSINGYRYWFNRAEPSGSRNYSPSTDFVVNGDSSDLAFTGRGWSIPLNVTVHFEFDRYKVGGGFMMEYHRPGDMGPNRFSDQINAYSPDFNSTFYKKYYFLFGAKIYRYNYYVLSADAHIGGFSLSRKFDKTQISKGIYLNLGVTLERELSEYVRVFARPSYDLKTVTLNLPESGGQSVKTNMNALFVQFGITYRIPELKRCFIKECRTQVNHQHGNMEYRSRAHPWYKKQNPHHGENYPTLIKYKGKNKKKMNPY